MKKVLCLVFLLLVSSFLLATGLSLKIDAERVLVGSPVKVEIEEGDASDLELIWYSDGLEVGRGLEYVPTPNDYESWLQVVAVGHIGETIAQDKIWFSRLPVFYINTDDNKPVTSRDVYSPASLFVQGNGEFEAQYDGKLEVKGRGTSSWHYDKKPYKLKLGTKTDLFGFGKSKHYVLLANYLDPSLLRNVLAFDISSRLGLVTPDYVWVDLVFNGEYAGAYLLTEHVRIGSQLVDIWDWEEEAESAAKALFKAYPGEFPSRDNLEEAMVEDLSWMTSGFFTFGGKTYPVAVAEDTLKGYLLELGFNKDKEVSHFTTSGGVVVGVTKPEYLSTNSVLMEGLEAFMQSVEDALRSPDGYNAEGQHYTELVDLDSMVSYWLTMEIMGNEDAAGRSRFCYVGDDGKLYFGPVWDFDISSGAFRTVFSPKGWNVTGGPIGWWTKQEIFSHMVDDPLFLAVAREKYLSLQPYLWSLVEDGGVIDDYASYLYEAGVSDSLLWQGGYVTRSFHGDKGDVSVLKAFLRERLEWLDNVFSTEEKLSRSLSHFLFAKGGYRPSSKVKLSYDGGILSVSLPKGSQGMVYVNGLKYGEASSSVAVPSTLFLPDRVNVVSVIATKGKQTYTNHISFYPEVVSPSAPSGASPCHHTTVEVKERGVTDARYGIKASWYCTSCHHYFLDEEGTRAAEASAVIVAPYASRTPGGIRETIAKVTRLLLLGVVLFLFLLGYLRRRRR